MKWNNSGGIINIFIIIIFIGCQKFTDIFYNENCKDFHAANGSFLFTLTNIHGIAPTKFPNKQNDKYAVYHGSDRDPAFGNGNVFYISNDYLNNNKSYSMLSYSYPDVLGKGNSIFSGEPNNNNNIHFFKLRELEVFKLFN